MRLRLLVNRLLALARGRRLDRELDDEIRAHLEMAERDAMAAGLSAEEARRIARLRFGAIDGMKEAHRDRRSIRWIEHLVSDGGYALAALFRSPGFTLVTVSVLALGIGATSAMFSLLDAVLLKPLPFPHSERMVRVWEAPRPGATNATSTLDYLDWKRLATSFEALSAKRAIAVTLTGSGDPVRLTGEMVTADYFKVFATSARLGRLLTDGDDRPGAPRVVVLSHGAWLTYFGGDRTILGRALILDGEPYQVVGVLPPGPFDRNRVDVWTPLVFTSGQRTRQVHWLTVYGRLRADASLTQSRAQMNAIHAAVGDVRPADKLTSAIVVEPLERLLVDSSLRRSVIVGFGAAGIVLLIACANVANLLLVKGSARRKELAIRAALGAGRGRLVSQLLTESLVLCAIGGIAGVTVAWLLIGAAAPVLADAIPFTADVRLDWRVLGFAAALVITAAMIVGALPAVQTRFGQLAQALNQSARGSSGAQAGVRRTIVAFEVALSLVLLCSAGLLFRTLINLERLESGVRIDRVLTIGADLPAGSYPTSASAAVFYESVVERLGAIPGITQAALTTHVPLRWIENGEGIQIAGREDMINVRFKRIDPNYFGAFDIPIVAGRGLSVRDRQGSPAVIVVNQALEARLADVAGITDPVGQVVRVTAPSYADRKGYITEVEIVGVIRSERVGDPWRPDPPVVYVPLAQSPSPSLKLIVRTRDATVGLLPSIREAVREVAPHVALGQVATMEQVRSETFAVASRPAWLIGAFAGVAMLLAALGVYGVLAHLVSQQRREIGIRMALGAHSGDVVAHVLRNALSMVVIGSAAGLAGAVALTRVMKNLLYEVSPLDPLALTIATVSMLLVGGLAAFLPASRAARVHPVAVLREEG